MKKYLHILEGAPLYPVFYDANRTVLSLPPIINSETTKITLDTKNVFIEMTGTDLSKLQICLAIVAGQFSQHCEGESQYTIEQVQVVQEDGSAEPLVTPQLSWNAFEVDVKYINSILGISLDADTIAANLKKMGFDIKKINDTKT